MKKILVIIIVIFSTTVSFSQNVKITASAKSTVVLGERFRLIYQVNTNTNSFIPPNLSEFQVLMGPSKSVSSSYNIVNGNSSRTSTTGFTYYLVAKKTGKFKIAPAQIKYKGKIIKSNELVINIVDKKTAIKNTNTTNQSGISNKDLYIKTHLSRNSVYEGEHLIATVKIYFKDGINIAGFDKIEMPSFDGFYTQEIIKPNNITVTKENINGINYNVGVLQKTILYPQKSGKISISPFDITCILQQRVQRGRSRNLFDGFFSSGYRNIKHKIRSNNASINVKALPTNKPKDFSGAVGKLNIKSKIDKTEVGSDEPIILTVTISGNGNMKLLPEPEIVLPPDFDVYDPKIKNNYKNDETGSHGNIKYEYLIIPRHGGEFKIPKIKLSYFDTRSKKYITKSTNKLLINVKKAEGELSSNTIASTVTKENLQYLGNDIRFIKTSNIKLNKKNDFIFGSLQFYFVYILSIVGFITIFILKRKRIKENANTLLIKNKKASKVAKKRFKLANKHLNDNNNEQFYLEITTAVWGYLSDKLSIQLANLSKENAIQVLTEKGICEEKISNLTSLLDICEFERFSSSKSSTQMHEVYENSIKLISTFENKI